MNELTDNPFYKASYTIHDKIVKEINDNLEKLSNNYIPSSIDNELYFPYGNQYMLNNTVTFFHPQFFFDIGRDLLEEVKIHEERIGKEICKEGIIAVMAMCSVLKNDILNYRVYIEKMMQQRSLYDPNTINLINLINTEPILGSIKRETERVLNDNSVIDKLKNSLYPDISLSIIANNLTALHQTQFINYLLNYRLLHYYLKSTNCPDIIYEHCYSLIQNLCILFESQLKVKKMSTNLLSNLLTQNIDLPYRNHYVSTLHLPTTYPTSNIPAFNINLPIIASNLDVATSDLDIVAYSIYVTYICRNQVLHNISDTIVFHGNPVLTEKVIGILLSSIYFLNRL